MNGRERIKQLGQAYEESFKMKDRKNAFCIRENGDSTGNLLRWEDKDGSTVVTELAIQGPRKRIAIELLHRSAGEINKMQRLALEYDNGILIAFCAFIQEGNEDGVSQSTVQLIYDPTKNLYVPSIKVSNDQADIIGAEFTMQPMQSDPNPDRIEEPSRGSLNILLHERYELPCVVALGEKPCNVSFPSPMKQHLELSVSRVENSYQIGITHGDCRLTLPPIPCNILDFMTRFQQSLTTNIDYIADPERQKKGNNNIDINSILSSPYYPRPLEYPNFANN